MYGGLGMSAPSLHRESTDSLIQQGLPRIFSVFFGKPTHKFMITNQNTPLFLTQCVLIST